MAQIKTSRRGRPPKGDREQVSLRFPTKHLALYREQARKAGIPLTDYMALRMAAAHDLDEPEYLTRDRGQGVLDDLDTLSA